MANDVYTPTPTSLHSLHMLVVYPWVPEKGCNDRAALEQHLVLENMPLHTVWFLPPACFWLLKFPFMWAAWSFLAAVSGWMRRF